jgi:hypothetical protein
MGTYSTFKASKTPPNDGLEIFHINYSKGKIKAKLKRFLFQDNDTKQYVAIIPSLDLTGYGKTKRKAEEMLKFSLDQFNEFIMESSLTFANAELRKLGWKKSKFKNKEYSRAFVDINGNLKEFNAVENKIESEILSLA